MKGKNKGKKLMFSGAFVVCMAFAILFTVFGTKASGETTGVVYEPCTKENTVPTKAGFLFGGWYQAGNDEEPVTNPEQGKTYYAKFVPENVLGIKAQVSNTILADSTEQTAAIRFVTTIDSVQYRKIGFLIQKGTGEAKEANVTNTVYESLYQVTDQDGTLGNTPEEVSPAIFDAASKYFKTYTIRKVPDSAYNTDITVTPYWITLDGTKVMGTKSIKTVNLGRSWVYVVVLANAVGDVFGTYAHPFTNLTDAFNGIRLENGGKVTVKGNSMVEVPVDFNWTKHTVAVKDQVKDCNIMITGETTEAGIDFSAAKELHIKDNVTFDAMTLKFYGKSLDDYGEVYANGNDFTIAAGVISENKFTTIFGGSKNADVTGDTKIELLAGAYKAVCGGGYNGGVTGSTYVTIKDAEAYTSDTSNQNRIIGGSLNGGTITGDTHVTIGGSFNSGLTVTDNERSGIYGGCYDTMEEGSAQRSMGIVEGDTYITINDNAKTGYIYGGGRSKSEVKGTCHVTVNGGTISSVYGGTEQGGKNSDTSVIINGGEINQIFGGSRHDMTGNTYVEINAGKIHRRIYGGCYSDVTTTEDYHVEGYATVVVKDKDALVLNQILKKDHSFSAGSRCKTGSDKEVGVLIFTDNIYENVANKVGFTSDVSSYINSKPYNYLIDATTGGTVAAGTKMLQIAPTDAATKGTVAFKDDGNVQVYFHAECSWPMVNVGAAIQKEVKVDFNASPIEDTSTFEASMDEIYYAQLEDAVDAANVRTDMPTVIVLKDADVDREMRAESGADFNVKSNVTEGNTLSVITGKVKEGDVNPPGLIKVLEGGTLTIENLKLVNGYNAIRSEGTLVVNHVEIENAANAGLSVGSKNNTVTDLTITGAGGNGVVVAAAAKADITNLTISGTGLAAVRTQTSNGKSGEVTIKGGNITTGVHGIYIDGTGKATITNVNVTATGNSSAAVYVLNKANLTVDGGTITATGDNTFGIWMDGGLGIIKNAAVKADKESAICTETRDSTKDNANLTLDNVTIERTVSNNKALVSVRETSTVTVQGANSKIDGKKASYTGRGVEVEGSFILNGGTITSHKVVKDTTNQGATALVTAEKVASGDNLADGSGVYVVNGGSFSMNGGYMEENDTDGNMCGAAVSVNGTGATFTLNAGEIKKNEATYGAVMVRNGLFEMKGGTITGNNARGQGGGVVVSKGTFTMSAGTISENNAQSGGGVFMNSTGKIILSDASTGIITKNEATSTFGGGMYITNGTLEISGGEISYNTAATYGGAIAITNSKLVISGGTISNNTATKNAGGAVDVNGKNATFTLTGGTISNNYGEGGGGGVCLRACAEASMSGGTIKANQTNVNNTAGNGGGILIATGVVFTMTEGEILENRGRNGGAIYLNPNSAATAKIRFGGGVISGNTSFNANRGGVGTGTSNQAVIIYINGKSVDDIADKTFNLKLGTE